MALAFGDLNLDIKCDVLKSLSLVERVQLERVNQEWRQVIESLWRSQFALYVYSKPINSFFIDLGKPCVQDCHQVRKKDKLVLSSIDVSPMIVLMALLTRCTNLQALHICTLNFDIYS